MKRTVAFVAGVLTLGVAIYAGSRLVAQPPAAARPAGAGPRVALLNLRFVIKHYEKYKAFMETMKKKDEEYLTLIKSKNMQADKLQKEGQQPSLTPARREQIEQDLRNLRRDVEDLTAKARKEMAKQGSEEMVRVYKEIRGATYRYADANNIDLVLHFEGAADSQEMDSPVLIQRNFNVGCCPLYWKASLDISSPVLAALNAAYRRGAGAAPGAKAVTPAPRR